VVIFEQFLFSPPSTIVSAERKPPLMPPTLQVGAILMRHWPGMKKLIGLESEPYSGQWTLLKAQGVSALDRKIHAAGWNFVFMATEVKVMFFGSLGAAKVQNALKRILEKVKRQQFNGVEVTASVTRHFLGVPYVTVSAHSRPMQQSCCLDTAVARQSFQRDAEWARACSQIPLRRIDL
jgi:hypothetical protein